MLINKMQLQSIEEANFRNLIKKVIDKQLEISPEVYSTNSYEKNKMWIEKKIREAVNFGIQQEYDIHEFIEISLHYPIMEHNPRPYFLQELLLNDTRTVEDKLNLLIENLEFNRTK
jgi:hypothetical protein